MIAALDDDLLKNTIAELKKTYSHLQFRAVGVNFGADGYLEAIANETKDIPVQLVSCLVLSVGSVFYHVFVSLDF